MADPTDPGNDILRVEDALKASENFLAPVLRKDVLVKARDQSLVDCLIIQLPKQTGTDLPERRELVLRAAVTHLWDIHVALIGSSDTCDAKQTLHNPTDRRVIDGLLDLISLEGIYPALSPGVGIPIERRVKSVLQAGVAARYVAEIGHNNDIQLGLLKEVVDSLSKIFFAGDKGVNPAIRERNLVDVICACGELAYGHSFESTYQSNEYRVLLERLLDEYVKILTMTYASQAFPSTSILAEGHLSARTPTYLLFPILTGLLQPSCPPWLRSPLTTALSLLPLRPGGVRQTITFLATTIPKPMLNSTSEDYPSGKAEARSVLSLETLTQASKLLSSVPSSLTPENYFTRLAPQLLDLLDKGPDELRRAAAFVVGSGILGRRAFGAPGTIGWKLFAQPIIERLNPTQDGTKVPTASHTKAAESDLDYCIVDEAYVQRALNRLAALILAHPNPGLTKRLVGQLVLPLWGLLCYARKTGRIAWLDEPSKLLHTYLNTAANAGQVVQIAEELLWDGGSWWTYGPERQGGIEIRKRPHSPDSIGDVVAIVQDVDSRVEEFLGLLGSDINDQQTIADVFMSITKRWLLPGSRAEGSGKISEAFRDKNTNPMHVLIYAKLAQGMLERYKDKLAGSPDRLLELVDQLMEEFVENDTRKNQRSSAGTTNLSLSDLGTIIDQTEERPERPIRESDVMTETEGDRAEIVSVALSLLSAILSSPDFVGTPKTTEIFSRMQSPLNYISRSKPSVPSSLSIAASNIVTLLDLQVSTYSPSAVTSKVDPHLNDRKTYSLALTHLSDSVVPVRAQGLSLLTTLISSHSVILDIFATSVLLLSLLQDEDEYIYLNAIKSLSLLAQHHPKTVVKMLAERYLDREEEVGLDQRLRIGEALLRTVEGLGEGLIDETARIVGDTTIELAGRRGRRPKAEAQRHKTMRDRHTKIAEAEEAWGGKVPTLAREIEDDVVLERHTKVVEGWEGKEAAEDVRIRTSALSVLGATIQTNAGGLGSTLTSTAVDMAISILTLELGDETAILRRAAVLLILNLAKAIDKAEEEGRTLGFGFAVENLEEVVRVLRYVEATDRDDVVKEYIAAVIESLESWRSKSLLGTSSLEGPNLSSTISRGSGRLAGLSVNPSVPSSTRPCIEEVE